MKGKPANGVGSQYSHTTSEHDVSSITTADAHTSAASSRLNWLPSQFKWTRPFRRKTKSGFCACAITFQTQSTTRFNFQLFYVLPHKVCLGFIWISEQTAIISLYRINWLVFRSVRKFAKGKYYFLSVCSSVCLSA